jgi:hypothetical protein
LTGINKVDLELRNGFFDNKKGPDRSGPFLFQPAKN